jgi:hypothetical protein
MACTDIGVDVGVMVGFGVVGLGVGVAGFGVGVAGLGVGVRAVVGLGDAVGVGVGDSVATADGSGVGLAEGSVIATLLEGSGDGSGRGEICCRRRRASLCAPRAREAASALPVASNRAASSSRSV